LFEEISDLLIDLAPPSWCLLRLLRSPRSFAPAFTHSRRHDLFRAFPPTICPAAPLYFQESSPSSQLISAHDQPGRRRISALLKLFATHLVFDLACSGVGATGSASGRYFQPGPRASLTHCFSSELIPRLPPPPSRPVSRQRTLIPCALHEASRPPALYRKLNPPPNFVSTITVAVLASEMPYYSSSAAFALSLGLSR